MLQENPLLTTWLEDDEDDEEDPEDDDEAIYERDFDGLFFLLPGSRRAFH